MDQDTMHRLAEHDAFAWPQGQVAGIVRSDQVAQGRDQRGCRHQVPRKNHAPPFPAEVEQDDETFPAGVAHVAEDVCRGLQRAVRANVQRRIAATLMDLGPHPVWLNAMPMFHIGG